MQQTKEFNHSWKTKSMSIYNYQSIFHIERMIPQTIIWIIRMERINGFKHKSVFFFINLLNLYTISITLIAILSRSLQLSINIEGIACITCYITLKTNTSYRLFIHKHRFAIKRINLQFISIWIWQFGTENIIFT